MIKICLFLNFANIAYDIVSFFINGETQNTSIIRNSILILINLFSGVCGVLNTIHNSGTFNGNWFERFSSNEMKQKSYEIIKSLEKIKPHAENHVFKAFRESIRSNLLSRITKSELLQIISILFFYFNVFINLILYIGGMEINSAGTKAIYLMFNIFEPLLCCFLSYIVILYDNIKSIKIYIKEVERLLNSPTGEDEIMKIVEKINQPILPFVS